MHKQEWDLLGEVWETLAEELRELSEARKLSSFCAPLSVIVCLLPQLPLFFTEADRAG